jgi:cob(I)alamin adenosyltransferase
MNKKGLIQIYTGKGKGKTTAAIGAAVRALGHGWTIYMFQFLKPKGIKSGEEKLKNRYKKFHLYKQDYKCSCLCKGKLSLKKNLEIKKDSLRILKKAEKIMLDKKPDMIIMDEINVAVNKKCLSEKEILDFIRKKPGKTELLLTGRRASKKIMAKADLITEMKEVRHPFNKGVRARRGIEY